MATASPTPMGNSHFGSLSRRPASRQTYRPTRPPLHRSDSVPAESHARTYSLNDSSDDEIVIPMMKFSAETNALLNDAALAVEKNSPSLVKKRTAPEEPYKFRGTTDKSSPPGTRNHSPYPRRVVRLSGTPGSSTLRRRSLSSSVQKYNENQAAPKAESPLDLSTPAQVPRTVRIPITNSSNQGGSGGSSANASSRTGSASREDDGDPESQGYPTTAVRTTLATSQGSVSRYGAIGRSKYGEDMGPQSTMRTTKRTVGGQFLSGPARRGKIRKNDEEQSPLEEQGDGLDAVGSSQEPQSQESQIPESQSQDPGSNQGSEVNLAGMYPSSYRDFASGSPVNSKDVINSMLRSKSPPPPTLASSQRSAGSDSKPRDPLQPVQPVFKVPAPRPDLPSAHDQENEAPPTFPRNKPAPLIHLDKMEKVPTRPESMDMSAMRSAGSPGRRALAPRSQNTPRRPAPPPPKMSILDAATSTAGAATASNASGKRNRLKVNGKYFTRLDCIGRGGSSRVYRVMAENSKMWALKRVNLDDADEAARRGFEGEIDLLEKLKGVDRVIRLIDHEMNEEKGILSVLMEMGELDMNNILKMRLENEHAKFDASFVRHYWKEMLECLQAVHEHDVVHSDLKPHNFVLVQGRLKLIDFGIANAIQTDETVNVHRETQIGTPNYMSPESLLDSNAKPDSRGRIANAPKLMKVGKPSDIWSLGCVLYQMVYGRAPFGHIQNQMQRCQAIINFSYPIEYPSLGVGNVPVPSSLIRTLQKCLNRDPLKRPSATELLSDKDPFLNPVDYGDAAVPMTEELLGRILQSVAAKIAKTGTPTESELLKLWPQGYFNSLRKNLADGKPL